MRLWQIALKFKSRFAGLLSKLNDRCHIAVRLESQPYLCASAW
jgi:hypothetical protein